MKTHGGTRKPEYSVWSGMISRCLNPREEKYPRYGGRGITVCEEWRTSFAQFLADVGPRPSPQHSLNRIDNDKGYFKGNCEWATQKVQARNRSTTFLVTCNGETKSLAAWCEELNLPHARVGQRLTRLGWSPEQALGFAVRPPQTNFGIRRPLRGSENARAKLNEAAVAAILYDDRPCTQIAKDYGVCRSTISHIKNGRNWKQMKAKP